MSVEELEELVSRQELPVVTVGDTRGVWCASGPSRQKVSREEPPPWGKKSRSS